MFEKSEKSENPSRKSNQRKTKVDYIHKANVHTIDWLKHKQTAPIMHFSNVAAPAENVQTKRDAPPGTMQCTLCGGMAHASEVSIKISMVSHTGYSITCKACKICK